MKLIWDIDPIIWRIGGVVGLRYYGLLFSCVLLGGYFLFLWQVKRAGGTDDDVAAMVFPGAIGTIVGARLGHVIFYEPWYALQNPLWVLEVWKGGLASHGATIGLLLAIWYYARRHGQSYAECLDRFCFSAALAATLVRIGNFFNSEIVGRPTDGTWGVRFPRYDMVPAAEAPLRHPTQLYEAAMGLAVLGLLLWVDRRLGGEKRPRGAITATFGAAYFTGRFVVEFFKAHQALPDAFPLTMGQLLSIPAALFGFGWLWRIYRNPVPSHWNVVETGENQAKATSHRPARRKSGRKKKR
ncbi:MAG: prolipoprotein diacylglyceryl transferase [Proteobacteria bacterium]|nr:prolipoprotein diacylglyceryl transferase [Pseudomonadota bacterium]